MRRFSCISGAAGFAALACLATPASADDDFAIGEDGIEISLGDDAVEIELGGKFQLDLAEYDNVTGGDSTVDFRRLRPDLRVRIAEVVSARAEWEFSGSQGWRNLYLQVEPIDGVTLRGGNFTAPFSMEDLQGSASIPFAERSLMAAVTPGFGLGGQLGYSARRFTARVGYFDDSLDPEEGRAAEHGEGFAGRLTFLPIDHEGTQLHLGLAAESRDFEPDESLRYSATAGTTFADSVLRTARLEDLSSLTGVAGEVGFVTGPIAVQGQYVHQWIDRDTLPDAEVSGGYVQAAWMVTGERYGYSRGGGTVSGPRLRDGLAVELASRFSWLDASDPVLGGDTAEALDISATLHLTSYAKVMLGGTQTWTSDLGGNDRDFTTVLLRLQLAF